MVVCEEEQQEYTLNLADTTIVLLILKPTAKQKQRHMATSIFLAMYRGYLGIQGLF